MLSRLNKKQVFRGDVLYLGNTVLVLSVFTQSSIAHNEYFSRRDVLNVCNKISWRIIANNKIVDAKEGSWITEKKYSESIRNVIGKAIADCLTKKNEFAGKTSIEGTITFDVEPAGYSPENWNAVVLWNLIHVYNCGFKNNGNYTIDEAFQKVEENVRNTYSTKIKGFDKILETAIRDIKEYARELNLQKAFHEFCEIYHIWLKSCRNDERVNRTDCTWLQVTPNLCLIVTDNTKETTRWLFEYTSQPNEKELELEDWATKANIKLKMQQISYNISNYKIMMDSVCSPYQVKMKIKDYYEKESTTVFIDHDNYTPEQKDIITVINYIITAKKPVDVESIYYDAKDGWKVKYKNKKQAL